MEEQAKDQSGSSPKEGRSELGVIESIRILAKENARAELDTEDQLLLFLQSWWSRTYNRPLKDPLLMSYTLEELIYEFYDRVERRLAEEEAVNLENDRIEDDKDKVVEDWIESEEKKELEALKANASKASAPVESDPRKDAENIKWMEKQLEAAKKVHGESFGEDIEMSFEDS
jgi:hypothetical protein